MCNITMLCQSLFYLGKLPIEIDIHALPEDNQLFTSHHLSDSPEEIPPPIPPRLP